MTERQKASLEKIKTYLTETPREVVQAELDALGAQDTEQADLEAFRQKHSIYSTYYSTYATGTIQQEHEHEAVIHDYDIVIEPAASVETQELPLSRTPGSNYRLAA